MLFRSFYYQGNLKDAQLPWNISVAYMLDGKNVAADELAGANGHLVISGSVTKNKLADGDFYEAYMVQAIFRISFFCISTLPFQIMNSILL